MAHQELDLFGNPITYLTQCLVCLGDKPVIVKPPTKQLTFFICKDCREKEGVSDGRTEKKIKSSGDSD